MLVQSEQKSPEPRSIAAAGDEHAHLPVLRSDINLEQKK